MTMIPGTMTRTAMIDQRNGWSSAASTTVWKIPGTWRDNINGSGYEVEMQVIYIYNAVRPLLQYIPNNWEYGAMVASQLQ